MTIITKNRTIRPSTRLESSKSYKIDTSSVFSGDILVVNINHESKLFRKSFQFSGSDVAHKNSISFRVNDFGTSIDISWSGATPIGTDITKGKTKSIKPVSLLKEKPVVKFLSEQTNTNTKTSFGPISDDDTRILILGTLPGDKSLELGEYYGHPRNRFWKIISKITGNNEPLSYSDKKALLLKTKIGVWDVAHNADRKGSLDSAILNEIPNDLESYIKSHKKLRLIGFNGRRRKAIR